MRISKNVTNKVNIGVKSKYIFKLTETEIEILIVIVNPIVINIKLRKNFFLLSTLSFPFLNILI